MRTSLSSKSKKKKSSRSTPPRRKTSSSFSSSQKKSSRKKKPALLGHTNQKRNSRKTSSDTELENNILALLKKTPLTISSLRQQLDFPSSQEPLLLRVVQQLEKERILIRIRKDHYIVPQTADLMVGKLQVHKSGAGHVLSEEKATPDLFVSPENMSVAMHGDEVIVRLMKDRRSDRGSQMRSRPREGSIIRILKRAHTTIVGTLQRSKNFFYVVADDPRFPHNLSVQPPIAPLSAKSGDKVVASLDRWENRHNNPEGTIIEVLGSATAPGVEMLSIIRKHQLALDFPQEVLKEAKRFSMVTERDLQGREDLRHRFAMTIDPDDARDFDDAIEVEATTSGWTVAIHIADVAHYVLPHSSLDQEARARGNSTYLVDRVIPMLPENLSNGLCSLHPDEDRLAFSVFATIDRQGIVRHTRFARTVICSKKRLTYKEALALLKKSPKTKLARHVHTAWDCSSTLRQRRLSHGALDLDMPEIKVRLNKEGIPEKLERIENDISHQLIEELMLLANEVVARHLTRHQQPNLYRVHEKPTPEKLEEYRELILSYGLKIGNLNHRNELQKLLRSLKGKPYESALKIGLLKSLQRARYAPEPLGHYGLQKKDYTHFTSPIRRYADLITHRALARQLGLTTTAPSSRDLSALGDHISTTERTSGDAEKESVLLKKLDYLEAQISARKNHSFQAQVIEARNYGLFVELPEILISGLVPVALMDDDFYIFEASRSRLIGQRKRRIYRAGDVLSVAVDRVDRFKQQIDFKIVSARSTKKRKHVK